MRVNGEKLYTLDEAKLELNREKCERVGHDYRVMEEYGDLNDRDPKVLACERCGRRWSISPETVKTERA